MQCIIPPIVPRGIIAIPLSYSFYVMYVINNTFLGHLKEGTAVVLFQHLLAVVYETLGRYHLSFSARDLSLQRLLLALLLVLQIGEEEPASCLDLAD